MRDNSEAIFCRLTELTRYLDVGNRVDCNIAAGVFDSIVLILSDIVAAECASLQLEITSLGDRSDGTALVQKLEQYQLLMLKIEEVRASAHDFFLLPHLGDPLSELTIIRKDTLRELNSQLEHLMSISHKFISEVGGAAGILKEGIRDNNHFP